jgi:hypothetical protein
MSFESNTGGEHIQKKQAGIDMDKHNSIREKNAEILAELDQKITKWAEEDPLKTLNKKDKK